jgi:hypothetical protein
VVIELILLCALVSTQGPSKCQQIEDRDRRAFIDLSPIVVDVDGDGNPDRISPRIYTVRVKSRVHGSARSKLREIHWITFDLETSQGRVLRSFFRYRYGTDVADYWVYVVVPCDVNRDGKTDLVFYSGDDTSDETIVLLNRGGRFVVHSRHTAVSKY